MKIATLVRGARQLLTLRGPSGPRRGLAMRELGIIPDGALLIVDGIITEVGPARRIENLRQAGAALEINAAGRVVMPGFVDSHTHLIGGPPRLGDFEMRIGGASREEIEEAGGGIPAAVRAVRQWSTHKLELDAQRTIKQFTRHGTTTLEAKSGYGLDDATERKILRALGALDGKPLDIHRTYLGAYRVPREFAGRADEYIEWMCRHMLPVLRKRKLARFVDVCCEEGAFTAAQGRRLLEAARELGFLLKVQAERSHRGALRLGVELGAVSIDHIEHVDREDIEMLARSATIATLLPGSVFHLRRDRYPPARQLIDAGAAVALASNYNPGSSPTCSLPMMMSLACAQMRMTPAETVTAVTINGAHALRCADRAGSLEAGKPADLIMLNVPDYREIPYRFGMHLIAMTMKLGQPVFPRLGAS